MKKPHLPHVYIILDLEGKSQEGVKTLKMLAQKLSRVTLKMSDLQEYEEVKRKRREAAKARKGAALEQRPMHRITTDPLAKKSPRKALMFDITGMTGVTTPARASTPSNGD